jgi:hypothetical protein
VAHSEREKEKGNRKEKVYLLNYTTVGSAAVLPGAVCERMDLF